MRFRKKTTRALKTLFFGIVNGAIEYKIARSKADHDELVDRIEALETMRSHASHAFGMVMEDEHRADCEVDETLH